MPNHELVGEFGILGRGFLAVSQLLCVFAKSVSVTPLRFNSREIIAQ